MLPAWIMLAFFAAVFPVSNGLLPKCDLTCKYPKSTPTTFEIHGKLVKTILIQCFIKNPQASNCSLDVSEVLGSSCNQNEDIEHYLLLTCDGTQYRPIITNEEKTYCGNYIGYLFVRLCGLLWQDLDLYGESLHLNVLYLEDYEDRWDEEIVETDYWKNHLDLRGENDFTLTDLQMGPVVISQGLREVGTLGIFNMDHIPVILQVFIWPLMAEIDFTNGQVVSSQFKNSRFQTTLPRLQTLEVASCNLTQPPLHFPWDDEGLVLPGNLSRTDIFNSHYSEAFEINVKNNYYRRILILDGNRITDLSNFTFKGNLQQISLKDNHLSRVNAKLFVNMQGLHSIYLNNNKLRSIPAGLFLNQDELFSVSLANNLLTDIPAGLFQSLPSLKNVDLSANLLTVIYSGKFVNLAALEKINLATNQLNFIADDAISPEQPSLKNIDLSKNQITTIPTFIFLLSKLESTDLSGNHITFESIKESLENISAEHLHWSQRKTSSSYGEESDDEPSSTTLLTFLSNNISTIDIEFLNNNSVSLVSLFFHYFNVKLDDNDFVCDCKVYSFYNHMHRKVKEKTIWKVNQYNKNNLKCKKPDHLQGKLLYNLDPSDFVCDEKIPLCPAHCTCFRRSVDKAVIVNCKQVQVPALPTRLPHGSIELDLSDNLITKFDAPYPYLAKLEKLNLHNNRIKYISPDVLDFLDQGHMRKLLLDYNRLRDLPVKADVFRGTNLSHLTLGNNPWECNCHTSWMKDWLIVRRDIIQDLNEVMCVTGKPAGQVYVEVKEDQFICITPAAIIVRNALLGVGAVLVLCVIAIILIYVYRGEIKILLYVHCNWHPFDAAEDADILDMTYDAFISYSGLDYKWVCFDLLPKLENHSQPYRVCVHDRDFMPGAYIEDNIMEAVQRSRRMIMVLTQNYLKSDWCMLEFRAAHNKVLNERTNYLILVLFDDVKVSDLDEDMQLYIRTNTYLARSNKWFYDKLFYSMPTKNLQELRKEMETKMGKLPLSRPLDFTNDRQGSSSSQISSNAETIMTNLV